MERIEIGQIVKPHGLKGEVVVAGSRLDPDQFRALGPIAATVRGADPRVLAVRAVRPFQQHLLVFFEGVDDKDAADRLHGAVLSVEADRLPPPGDGEVYLFQLLGLPVTSDSGEELGRVADVFTTGAAPVLVVRAPAAAGEARGRERLLPMSPDVLVSVDTAGGGVVVRLLPGMEDL